MQYFPSHVATIRLSFCPKMASKAISEHLISKKSLGEHAPRSHSCACIRVITRPCNPPSKNPGYGPVRYVRVRLWRLLDAVSKTCSFSVLLSAVVTTYTTQIAQVLAWWQSLHTCARAAFTSCDYYSRAAFISFKSFGLCGYILFVGGVYLKKNGMLIIKPQISVWVTIIAPFVNCTQKHFQAVANYETVYHVFGLVLKFCIHVRYYVIWIL